MACTLLALVDPIVARLLVASGLPLPAVELYQAPAFLIILMVLVAMARTLPQRSPGRHEFGIFAMAVSAALAFHFAASYFLPWVWWMHWFRSLPLT